MKQNILIVDIMNDILDPEADFNGVCYNIINITLSIQKNPNDVKV